MKNVSSFIMFLLLCVSCTQEDNSIKEDKTLKTDLKTVTKQVSINHEPPKAFNSAEKIVDKMPLFGGCETKVCSDTKLIKYLMNNLEYPLSARKAEIEGRVYIQFIVKEDGSVSDLYVVRDLGGGTGEAAAKVVQGINDLEVGWAAGENAGVKVPVLYTLPISFVLEQSMM